MNAALRDLSPDELICLIEQRDRSIEQRDEALKQRDARIFDLEFHNEQLRRLIFGATRERFVSDVHASQLQLGLHGDAQAVADAVTATLEKISYERSKPGKKHEGRMSIPEHLPVVETVIEPEEDVAGMALIGREQTDELELNPASLYVKRTTRPKYAAPMAADGSVRVVIAPMPKRPVDKLLAGTELLTTIIVDKHVHHLPIDRQLKRYAMLGVDIPVSTAESWQHHVAELLQPMHAALKTVILRSSYLQVDETGIAVQDRTKHGTTHKGFLWGYHAPLLKAVFFDYRKGRGQEHCREILDDFTGYLQTDDYQAYHRHKARDGVVPLACWAHARRNFEKALDSDRTRATTALQLMQGIYAVERQAREEHLTPDARKELRLDKALPVLNVISKWLVQELELTQPRSPIGKAIRYAVRLWDDLIAYLYNGHLEIDNNLMENAIRPVALGRKNWLFAGSHDAAQNIAMYRSLFGTCQLNSINPNDWLRYVLTHINSTRPAAYHTLLPHAIDPERLIS